MQLEQENLINLLGIENLPQEEKLRIVDKASELVQKRVVLRVVEGLEMDKKQQFAEFLQKGDQEKLAEFLVAESPNLDTMIMEEIGKVKAELQDTVDKK